jgi:WD repeat-containing protein 68
MLSLIAGDDNQVLVWDLNLNANNGSPNATSGNRSSHHRHHQGYHNGHQMQRHISDPILAYSAESEINSLCWNQSLTDWIGVGFGRTVQALRV